MSIQYQELPGYQFLRDYLNGITITAIGIQDDFTVYIGTMDGRVFKGTLQ